MKKYYYNTLLFSFIAGVIIILFSSSACNRKSSPEPIDVKIRYSIVPLSTVGLFSYEIDVYLDKKTHYKKTFSSGGSGREYNISVKSKIGEKFYYKMANIPSGFAAYINVETPYQHLMKSINDNPELIFEGEFEN